MPITNFKIQFPGQTSDGVLPRLGHLLSTDTLAQVTAPGYVNPYIQSQGMDLKPSDVVLVAASDGNQLYKPVFSASGIVTLTLLP